MRLSAVFLAVLLQLTCSCDKPDPAGQPVADPQIMRDLPQILQSDTLIALTAYSANSYYIYRGQASGFEYELLEALAGHLDVTLKIQVVRDQNTILNLLNIGKGDLIAHNLAITQNRQRQVAFTTHHTAIPQVLVQRLPDDWRKLKQHEIESRLLRNAFDLIGKQVYVRRGSSYYDRLLNLSEEIGGDINIVEVDGDIPTYELIRQVSQGEIDYTIADENIARINQAYFDNIDLETPVSLPQRIAWAVRKNSPELLEAINLWLGDIRRTSLYNVLYAKYYRNKRYFRQKVSSEYYSTTGGRISAWDSLFMQQALRIGWDWRLLAAQAYQESQFDPQARSWAGAIGLMQLMPETAKRFGAGDARDPNTNISAAVGYLNWLEGYWQDIPDSLERLRFVLASYNVGQGHVRDAARLAAKYQADSTVWQGNVAEFLLKKAQARYYNDEVCQFGYCQGEEPVNYVTEILQRFAHYKQLVE